MARTALTGSRIRERREVLGLRQADLARQAGISASYLNLIEHNRRRIGGKLLLAIAGVLGVPPAALSDGAGVALTATLREAAADAPAGGAGAVAEVDRVDEFAGRYPGWAQLLAEQHARIGQLGRSVEALTDRLSHDPHLAAALHEVLSTVTAIRSSASILVDTRELEPEWRDRFHRNIHEDSARLAEGAQRLVDDLDSGRRRDAMQSSPQDEVEAFLRARDHHLPQVEAGDVEGALAGAVFASATARGLARDRLRRMARDAARLPAAALLAALAEERADPVAPPEGPDPSRLAAMLGLDTALVMRRLPALDPAARAALMPAAPGLVIADASGTILERATPEDFPVPQHGAACPLWPLFLSFARPQVPLRQSIRMAGRSEAPFTAYAIAQPEGIPRAGEEPVLRAHMLLWPGGGDTAPRRVGIGCRICPTEDCAARREPSIMSVQ